MNDQKVFWICVWLTEGYLPSKGFLLVNCRCACETSLAAEKGPKRQQQIATKCHSFEAARINSTIINKYEKQNQNLSNAKLVHAVSQHGSPPFH